MFIKVRSVFDCNASDLFNEVKKSKSLLYIAKPLVKFVPVENHPLPDTWEEGKYLVKMYIFGFIPFGTQWIVISVDEQAKHIRDNGYSQVISKWDHHIQLEGLERNKTLYVDTIEISAGALTPFVVSFAHLFYRWRQRRWKKLITNKFNYNI
jgi:hypothetical protein